MSSSSDPSAHHPGESDSGEAVPPSEVSVTSWNWIGPLFAIPMVVVFVVVGLWLSMRWLVSDNLDAIELARELRSTDRPDWHKAVLLAELIRLPENEALRQDPELVLLLAETLNLRLDEGRVDESSIRLRMFLCRAIGECRGREGLPALLRSARQQRHPAEMEVRRSAVEALALRASHGNMTAEDRIAVTDVLLDASQLPPDGQGRNDPHEQLRSAAAFALGIVGGQRSAARLADIANDPSAHPDTQYNAATALARLGDARAVPLLVEMLGPDNSRAIAGEADLAARQWKQALVLRNGLAATEQLIRRQPPEDPAPLAAALKQLASSPLDSLPEAWAKAIRHRASQLQAELRDAYSNGSMP